MNAEMACWKPGYTTHIERVIKTHGKKKRCTKKKPPLTLLNFFKGSNGEIHDGVQKIEGAQ